MDKFPVDRSFTGTSLPPRVEGKIKGELTVQLLSIDWNVTPAELAAGCSLSIHWWGQALSENLVLLIPNGSCPPSVTTTYPLVSSMNQIFRYFQDMAALDFCLVIGMNNTEENFGIRMGRFSMDIGQLSDNHPIESTIPVFERSGVHLASTKVRISLVYGPQTPMGSANDLSVLDILAMNVITSLEHNEYSPLNDFSARGNLCADGQDKLTDKRSITNRQKQLYLEFDIPLTGTGYPLPGSANINHLIDSKPLITYVGVPAENVMQMTTSPAPQSPRKQIVFDVETPMIRQLVMDGNLSSATEGYSSSSSALSSLGIVIFSDELSSSSNLDLKPALEGAIPSSEIRPSLLTRSAEVSPGNAMKSKKQRHRKLPLRNTEQSAKHRGSQSSSPNRIRARSPKRRALNVKSGQQSGGEKGLVEPPETLSGQMSGAAFDNGQSRKMTTEVKRPKLRKPGEAPPNPETQSESSPERSYKVRQKSPVSRTTLSKANTRRSKTSPRSKAGLQIEGSKTKGKPKKSSKRSRPREAKEALLVHCTMNSPSEAGKFTSSEFELVKEKRHLYFPDRYRLSGNLAILPEDMVGKYLERISSSREKDDSLYQESMQNLIQKIVAFRTTLNKSSVDCADGCTPFQETKKLSKTKRTTLVKRLKQLDENIGSVSRILTSLTQNSTDLPLDARVAQTEFLEDDPEDVAEAALVEELFFPKTESELKGPTTSKTRSEERRKHSAAICEIHNYEVNPKKHVFVEGLPLRYCEAKPTVSKSSSTKPLLESLHGQDGTQEQSDNILAFSLSLALKVGKLVLSESTLSESRQATPTLNDNPLAWSFKQDVKISSCLLTISFPGLHHSNKASSSAPEQSITLHPTQLSSSELSFGNESQLHWKNVKTLSLETWMSERMIIHAFLSWDTGQSLTCEGSVVLEEVFSLMPKAFQTKLGLFKARKKASKTDHETGKDLESWDEAAALVSQMENTPAATLEVAIDLLVQDSSGKAIMGPWLYVTVACITGSKLQPYDDEATGYLLLIVKSDLQSICQIPFCADWRENPGDGVKAWRPWKDNHPDAVLRGPKQTNGPTVFIEVWRNHRGGALTLASSRNLVGLVKVPLKSPSNVTKVNEGSLVAEGDYYIWNPFKDVLCGSVEVRIVMGPEAQMLRLLQQNRAARIIQSYAPCRRDDGRAVKHRSSSVAEYNPFRIRKFPKDENKMVKHVIEVTVLHATDLPESTVFAQCEGTFIKYLFPCDEEALYTETMEWRQTIHFSASVHHGIILPAGQRLDNHLKSMNKSTTRTGDLIFELWGCYSSLSDEQTYPPNVLKLSDSGALPAWDIGREPTCKHGGWDPKQRERLIGSAKLLQWSLLGLIAAKPISVPEIKKRYYTPIQLESSILNGAYIRAPCLAVEVTYFTLNEQNIRDYIRSTIFSKVKISEDSLFEGVVECDIVGATGLQHAEEIYGPDSKLLHEWGEFLCSLFSVFSEQIARFEVPSLSNSGPDSCTPLYKWSGGLKIVLNVPVLKELKVGRMSFEVWHHHFPQARRSVKPVVPANDSLTTDIWLGTALIPTDELLESEQGIDGCYDLTSRKGQKVGAINVQVYFKQWHVRPREFTSVDTNKSFGKGASVSPQRQGEEKTWKL